MKTPSIIMNVSQVEPLRFMAKTSTGMEIFVEPGTKLGGKGVYPNPMEYFIAAIGTCIAIKTQIDLVELGSTPESIAVKMECTRSSTLPEVLEDIHLTFTLTGILDEKMVKNAISEVMKLYCPVAAMVSMITNMSWELRIS